MKSILRPIGLLVFGTLAASSLCAAIEPAKIVPTFVPQLSPFLLMNGITEAKVALVIGVTPQGQIADWLVLGYTDREMVDPCIAALKDWTITPTRIDGQPVPTQIELTVTVTGRGVVVSRVGPENLDLVVRRMTGNPLRHRPGLPSELDRVPARLNTVEPGYATAAANQGVRGKVQVHFYIDEHGEVRMPAIDASAHPYLSDIAVAAVREWRFEPPTSHGRPVLIAASQEFDFGSRK